MPTMERDIGSEAPDDFLYGIDDMDDMPPLDGEDENLLAEFAVATELGESHLEPSDSESERDIKHPLQNIWTLWYLEDDNNKSEEENLNVITDFDTVEDFWSVHNNIKPPSAIKTGCNYSLFKKGIHPIWQDAAKNEGGCWLITADKCCNMHLDRMWLDVLLCLIGGTFRYADQISGAVINVCGDVNKLSIWTTTAADENAVIEIGQQLRLALDLESQAFQYLPYEDKVANKDVTKPMYTL